MKERITYVVRDSSKGFDPSNIEVNNSSVSVGSLDGVKEHHITLGLDELPHELLNLLTDVHELHIRWSTPRPYESIAPYTSRVSPGLHVSYTPLRDKPAELCPLLKKAFNPNLKCIYTAEAFTTPPNLSGRFSHSASHQFHHLIPTINHLVTFIQNAICSEENSACKLRVRSLLTADSVDADYDAISHALVLRAYWSKSQLRDELWWETHLLPENSSLEVGILINERPEGEEELRYSGFLTQVGNDQKPLPTLFSFPSRHHPLPISSTFTTSFKIPTGLHPTLTLSFPLDSLDPPAQNCYLHTYLTLPSSLFIDRYPLSDPLTLSSHNLRALHALSGATDLEAPDWIINEWGSAALFEIALPLRSTQKSKPKQNPKTNTKTNTNTNANNNETYQVTIPTHLRYLNPTTSTSKNGKRNLAIPNPTVFWACSAEKGSQFTNSPFDRRNLGYDGLFGERTLFHHFNPLPAYSASASERSDGVEATRSGGLLISVLEVPVLDLNRVSAVVVEWGTVFVILFGVVWVGWSLVRVLVEDLRGMRKGEVRKVDLKKTE